MMTMNRAEISDPQFSGYVGGQVPVQGFGTVGAHHWYFRARGDRWSLDVGTPDSSIPDYVDLEGAVWSAAGFWGTWPEAGWMDMDVAVNIIREALAQFLAGTDTWNAPPDFGK